MSATTQLEAPVECDHPPDDVGLVAVALARLRSVRERLDVLETDLTQRLLEVSDKPEATLSDVLGLTARRAESVIDRAQVLRLGSASTDELARLFRSGEIAAGHVDTFVATYLALEHELRDDFLADTTAVSVAGALSRRRFAERLRQVAERLRRQQGIDLLRRQKRDARLRTWFDRATGMFHLKAVIDPEAAVGIASRLEAVVREIIAGGLPDTCPSDPFEVFDHLRSLALSRIFEGTTERGGGAAEVLVVVDTTQRNQFGEPTVDWGLPVELPLEALTRFFEKKPGLAVVDVARNGKLIDRTERLDLGRSTRLASRAQRRALRGLHPTCVVPQCSIPFHRCEIHHVQWWRHGGGTDLGNLAPVCSRHHHRIHENGWTLAVDERREVKVELSDGQVMTTGPPPVDYSTAG